MYTDLIIGSQATRNHCIMIVRSSQLRYYAVYILLSVGFYDLSYKNVATIFTKVDS